jgi:CMP-N,N'-diacetyllegionaminic acid synthase
MYKNKSFLAIIPARGGSKRLPNKNILPLLDKPLIHYSINAAKESKYIDEIALSSDSKNILSIAKEYEIMTIKRPDTLASDTAGSYEVVEHVIKQLKSYDFIVLLQPTSPLRTAQHIDEAIELLKTKNADAVISVSESEHSPLWSNKIDESLSMENFIDEEISTKRSQDLPTYYRLNGAIYICNTQQLLKEKEFLFKENIFAYMMEQKHSVDIDTLIDFKLAEFLLSEEQKLLK